MIVVWLAVFLAASALAWLSSLGYLFFLEGIRLFRRRPEREPAVWPAIAVVVPTLNEEEKIPAKLEDLRRCDYPADKIRLVVVDGGSSDRTAEIVLKEAGSGERLQLVPLPHARGKADQVRSVLERLTEDIVVFTDADSRLDPSCVRELVAEIAGGRAVSLAAAVVTPDTSLLEERIHWMFLNRLWWLEGEVLSCSGLSGVCYALKRTSFLTLDAEARAEDIRLGAMAGAKGMKAVLARKARAVELRVPGTKEEFLDFRRRRGSCYLAELLRTSKGKMRSKAWRLARSVRIWQMAGLPWALAAALLSGAVLLATRFRTCPPAVFAWFPLTAYLYALALSKREIPRASPFGLAIALVRYAALLFVSLFRLRKNPAGQGPRGGGFLPAS
ncbi:MAG: glycosyltransferase [Candidatus Aminicenantes bacterium]|nr:glycosyltransferase [Candidatus Aminicenantes bacterium]